MDNYFNKLRDSLPGFSHEHLVPLLNAYLDNNVTETQKKYIEDEISKNSELRDEYSKRLKDKEKIFSMIPKMEISKDRKEVIGREIKEASKIIFKKDEPNIVKKVWKFLDTPIL